ncbi:MAG: hypothetical protein AAGA65_26025 [Actinomycetota bacterium]
MTDQRATSPAGAAEQDPPAAAPTSPVLFDATNAASLRITKSAVLKTGPNGSSQAAQFGGGYLEGTIDLPEPPPGLARGPHIDMFVCGADGSCEPTGSNQDLIALWQPAVQDFAGTVYSAMAAAGVTLAPVAYVTASLTPGTDIIGDAHFDDDQYLPDAGVGLVAILGSDAGPRVATEPIAVVDARPGLPMAVEETAFARFAAGRLAHQQAGPGRIVVFPQFGQLHAGPALAATDPTATRRLLVMRAETVPDAG